MFKFILSVPLMVLVGFTISMAADDSIKIVPGNYSITTKTTSNFDPNPRVDTEDECIDDKSFDPSMALPDEDACSTSNVKKSGNKLTFDIKCEGGDLMPSMIGNAEASSTSSTISFKIKMTGDIQGQQFSVDSESEGKRTGPCD